MSFIVEDYYSSGLHSPSKGTGLPSNQRRSPEQLAKASAIELNEDDDSIRLSMDWPGVRAKDVEVLVQRGILSIRGHRIIRGMDHRIIKKQKLFRRFAVDTDVVDVSRASANLANGVLMICAPKKSKPVTFKIPVTEDSDFDAGEVLRQAAAQTQAESSPSVSSPFIKIEPLDSAEPIASTVHHIASAPPA